MPTYQSMTEYDGQVLNGMEDFCKRFDKNIDKYITLHNYIYYQHTYDVNRRYITDMYPEEFDLYVENILQISLENGEIDSKKKINTKEEKEYYIRRLMFSLLDIASVSDYSDVVIELNLYLEKVIEYIKYCPSDEYKLFELVKNDPFDTSKKFKNLYDLFFFSDKYNSLVYLLNNVYNKLLLIEMCNEEEMELKKYLANIFHYIYNFNQMHYCITELDKTALNYI